MHIFSILLIFYIIYIFAKNKDFSTVIAKLLALDLSLHLCVGIGDFINIAGFSIDYYFFIDSIIMVFLILRQKDKIFIKKRYFNIYIMLLLCILIGILNLIFFPYKNPIVTGKATWETYLRGTESLQQITFGRENIITIIKAVFTITMVCIIKNRISIDIWQKVYCEIYKWFKLYLFLGLLEVITKYIFKSNIFISLTIAIFGSSINAYDNLLVRGNGYMLQGLMREGAHYAFSLFGILCFMLGLKQRNRCTKYWIILAVILSLMSTTASAIWCLTIFMIIFIIYKYSQGVINISKLIKIFSIIVIITAIVSILGGWILILDFGNGIYMMERLKDALCTIMMAMNGHWKIFTGYFGSNQVRMVSMAETFKLIIKRPLFGFGIGTIGSHSQLATLMSSIGILGTVAWYKFSFHSDIMYYKNLMPKIIIICYLIANILAGGDKLIFSMNNLLFLKIATLFGEKVQSEKGLKYENFNNNSCI